MTYLTRGLRYLLAGLSWLLVVLTLVSVWPSNVWWIQVLGFPRQQALGGLAACLLGWWALPWPAHQTVRRVLWLGSAAAALGQACFLWPYLPVAPRAVPDAQPTTGPPARHLRLLVINVLMTSRQDARLRQLVSSIQPDVLLALEPDTWWARALRPLHAAYPYRIELPRADAYGMLLYSRLPLSGTQVYTLLQRGVPSIRTRLRLPGGRQVTLFGIHPTPPIPDTYPDGVGLRGEALRQVTALVRQDVRPVIVAGDFNDVSWSNTIHQLTRTTQLGDVSQGRGLYNTFDARSLVLRWPLDHFFVSDEFRVVALRRLPAVGSDHFPLYVELALPD